MRFSYIGGAGKTWPAVMSLARLSIICPLQYRNSGDAWLGSAFYDHPEGHAIVKILLPGQDPCHGPANEIASKPAKQAALLQQECDTALP